MGCGSTNAGKMQSSLRYLSLMWLGLLVCAGCGGGLVQVGGKVLVDGQPAEGVSLIFHPLENDANAVPATTISGPDGQFTLSTNMEPGIPRGSYKVTATWPDPKHKGSAIGFSDPEPAPDLFKGRYTGRSSVMTKEINGSDTEVTIELSTSS